MDDGVTKPFAISCGDPAGIGPEIICKSWLRRKEENLEPFFVVGNFADFENRPETPAIKITDPGQAAAAFASGLPVFHAHEGEAGTPGMPSVDGAQCALHALEIACGLARSGDAGAVVTAPVSKSQLYQAGFRYPGQTEFVSERCGIARGKCGDDAGGAHVAGYSDDHTCRAKGGPGATYASTDRCPRKGSPKSDDQEFRDREATHCHRRPQSPRRRRRKFG